MTTAPKNYVAYYRVSTQQQGASGLGLEAQKAIVQRFTSDGQVLAEYTEIETGKRANRPQLTAALARARLARATLVVAKLDRLARNVAFTSALMESGVDFICCDNPNATRLVLHVLAAVAEAEAEAISSRTKAALAAYKARGGKLGSASPGHWEGREDKRGWRQANAASAEKSRQRAHQAYAFLVPVLQALEVQYAADGGGPIYQRLADHLNATGHCTTTGKPFGPTTVWRILQRAG